MNWWEELWSLKVNEGTDAFEIKEIAISIWPCVSYLYWMCYPILHTPAVSSLIAMSSQEVSVTTNS